MKPLNFGSTFIYSMVSICILCASACLRAFGQLVQLAFMGIIGIVSLVLIVHSSIILLRTSSESDRKACKVDIIFACVFITVALIPFAAEKLLYTWANYRIDSMSR